MDDDFDVPKKKNKTQTKLIKSNAWGAKIGLVDVKDWTKEKFQNFITFCEMFFENGIVKYDKMKLVKVQDIYDEDPASPICEFFQMIGKRYDYANESKSVKEFYMLFMLSRKIVFSYIRKHPECLAAETVEFIKGKSEYAGCFMSQEEVSSLIDNAEMLTREALAITEEGTLSQAMLLERAIMKVTRIYNTLAGSITDAQIRALSTKDRIMLLSKLQFIHNATKGVKSPNLKFTQINVKSGGREELEDALLQATSDDDL